MLWVLPAHGDGHFLGGGRGARASDLACFGQLAQATDSLGYDGVLFPTGKSCEDSWLVAAAMVPLSRRLRFLVAVRPDLQPPTLAARMAATLDQLSDGRALINVVTGGDAVENVDDGGPPGHAERYRLTSEFLTVYRRLLAGETVDFAGRHFQVDGAQLPFAPVQEGGPSLWFGGSSAEASKIAAATIDRYLTRGDPPSRRPSLLAPTATITAIETTRPFWRTFT